MDIFWNYIMQTALGKLADHVVTENILPSHGEFLT